MSLIAITANAQPVEAAGTVYIRADGTVDPPSAPISNVQNVYYTLTNNIAASLVVERSNIVLNGAGYTLTGGKTGNGVSLTGIGNVTLGNVTIKEFAAGIWLSSSSQNRISANTIANNTSYGVYSEYSSNNTYTSNSLSDNGAGFYVASFQGAICLNNNVSANRVTNNNGTGIYLGSAQSSTVASNTIEDNEGNGIEAAFSSNNSITSNTVRNNARGIRLSSSHYVFTSSNNNMSLNTIADNKGEGIFLASSPSNCVSANDITNNTRGIVLDYVDYWIRSSNNTLTDNNIESNGYGVYARGCSANTIFHNDFKNNTVQAFVQESDSNVWDNGYPSGGNYWSDYQGVDEFSGPGQNQPGSDGVGDAAYVIDASNQDEYPFMDPTWKADSALDFSLSPNPAGTGKTVTMEGELTARGLPIGNAKIDVYVNDVFNGSLFTNPSGDFTAQGKLNALGTYRITLNYAGSAEFKSTNNSVTISIYQTTDTKVIFRLSPNSTTVGQTIRLEGNLSDASGTPLGNVALELWGQPQAGSWRYLSNLSANATGWFTASGQIVYPSTYQIAVVYRGTSQYNLSYHIEALIVSP